MIIIINFSNEIMSITSLLTPVLTFLSCDFHTTVLFLGLRFFLFLKKKKVVLAFSSIYYFYSKWFLLLDEWFASFFFLISKSGWDIGL